MFDSKIFIRQLIGYFPSQIVPALSNLGIILILTRFMTVESYGYYTLLITTVNLTVTIFTQWMIQSILFFRPKYQLNNRIIEFDGLILKIYALLATIIFSLIIILIPISMVKDLDYQIIIPILLIILFNSIFVINQTIMQSDMKVGKYSLQISLSSLMKLALIVIIAIYFSASLPLLLWGTSLSYFLFVVPKFIELLKGIQNKDNKKETKLKLFLSEMLRYGFPMLGWFLATSLISMTDRYILAFFKSDYEVGLYSANVAIVSSALGLVFTPFIKAIHPIIMNSASSNEIDNEAISNLMSRFSLVFIVLGIPVLAAITILRAEISELLLGVQYVEGSIIIPYTLYGLFLWNLAMIGHKGFEVNRNTKQMFVYVLVACILNLLANLVLIPPMGILGAGIASLIAYASYPILIKINSNKNIYWKIPWIKVASFTFFGVITYSVANLISNYYYNQNLFAQIIVVGMVILILYTVLCYIGIKFLKIKLL